MPEPLKRCDSPPCRSRSRQRDGQGIAAQDHQGNQPADRPLAVRVGADELRDVADGCGLSLDPSTLGARAARSAARSARVEASR
jgi:hypothetical protein